MILNPYSTCNNLKILSVCTCVYVDVGVYVYICIYMCIYIYMYMYVYVYIYIYGLMVIKLNIFLKQKLCVFLCCKCNH